MKRAMITMGLAALAWTSGLAPVRAELTPPAVTARAAILIDGASGQVLYGKNIHEHLPQASTTKLMAALVAIEHGNLSDVVEVSDSAAKVEGSSMYLEAGEHLTLEQLLYGMMLVSGNDATTAVAEHVGGSLEAFVALMNAKAEELGLQDTHFETPHGLPNPGHYSSASDLATLARAAFMNTTLAKISSTRTMELPGNSRIKKRLLVNHNRLLKSYPGAWGGKTGYTTVAGKCFVGAAKREGRYVIEAILSDPDCWRDAQQMLDYGLQGFDSVPVLTPDQPLGEVVVAGGRMRSVKAVLLQPLTLSVPRGAGRPEVETRALLREDVTAPVSPGQPVGTLQVTQQGKLVATAPLVAAEGVPLGGAMLGDLGAIFTWFLKGGTVTVALFSVLRWQGGKRRLRFALRRRSLQAASRLDR